MLVRKEEHDRAFRDFVRAVLHTVGHSSPS
jgi:hypothetical protein